jgi:HisJ family histidinol phosphate phosphatase
MTAEDPRIAALPDIHGHAKGEHKPFAEERPIPYTARMLFLWFFHACRRSSPRFLMVADHVNYLTFEDPAAVNLVRRALKLAAAGDLYGAAETAGVELAHAAVVSEGLRKGMRYSIGAEIDNDPRSRPDAQNIVDAMRPDGMVRSIHFLPIDHPTHGENWMWPFDNPEFIELYEVVGVEQTWELYMAALLDAIDKLPGNIVGHFYVPAKFGHWPSDEALERYEDQLVAACAERSMAIELNSRYFYKYFAEDEAQLQRYRDANLRLLRKAKEKGVAIAVGSDAHSPRDQGSAFEQVLALLDAAEINEIAFPINGRLARVALRATEEILRKRTAATPPAGSSVSGFSKAEIAVSGRNGGPLGDEAEDGGELVAAAPSRERRPRPAAAATAETASEPEAQTERGGASEPQPSAPAQSAGEPVAVEAARAPRPPRPKRPKRVKAEDVPVPAVAEGGEQAAAQAETVETEPAPVQFADAGLARAETVQVEAAAPEAGGAPEKAAVRQPARVKAAAKAPVPKTVAPKALAPKVAAAKPAVKATAAKKAAPAKKTAVKKAAARPAAAKPRAAAKKAAPARKTAAKSAKRTLTTAKRAPSVKKSVAKKAPAKKKASKTKR